MSTGKIITLALDAMGGDRGLIPNLEGAVIAANANPVKILLVGNEEKIKSGLKNYSYPDGSLVIVPASQIIEMGESPQSAIKNKPDASILVAANLVQAGKASVLISAGSTGSVVLAAAKFIPRIRGVRRTAIATVYPTMNEFKKNDHLALLLDVGANVQCNAEELAQFGIMGAAYVSEIRDIENPTVALLNIGEESSKGGRNLQTAYKMLKRISHLNFIGNIEGKDILRGVVDVIVTEGFVGNIVIKTLEGSARAVHKLTKMAYSQKLIWKLGLLFLKKGLKILKETTDYTEYGGAPLLGFEKMVIIAHGCSNGKAISNALKLAGKCVRDDVCGRIAKYIEEYEISPDQEFQRLSAEI